MDTSSTSLHTDHTVDPFILYARSLHHYTLGLWTETRRIAEEKARARQIAASPPKSRVPAKVIKDEDEAREKENTQPDQSSDDQT
ncbi:hypothetical protein BYT27DRAFT_6598302 [Phlegmacium glaucopus]|nr:hypothetical protein BYT27DRAFT_6598302 [Phlegmacium glaucopus]